MALGSIEHVAGRHILKARRKWWKYEIAFAFKMDPDLVDGWDADKILEALAAIGNKRKGGGAIE